MCAVTYGSDHNVSHVPKGVVGIKSRTGGGGGRGGRGPDLKHDTKFPYIAVRESLMR